MINLVEILKNAPVGTKLWSPICGECILIGITSENHYPYRVSIEKNYSQAFTFLSDGRYADCLDSECLLFPSKDNRDWSTFKAPWKHKHFEPFQKVLITIETVNEVIWYPAVYAFYNDDRNMHQLLYGGVRKDSEIIPYEGNENKLGKPVKE